MRESSDFNTGDQAMLEEAFASLYTNTEGGPNASYDIHLKDPAVLKGEADSIFNLQKTPLYRGMVMGEYPYFTDSEKGQQATVMIREFLEQHQSLLEGDDPFAHLALFSQGAAFAEGLGSASFTQLTEDDKLEFIRTHLALAGENINALVTGEASEEKTEKYKLTLVLTRESFARSMEAIKNDPDKPVFIELLLETLAPLYNKAKAQADTLALGFA